MPKALKSLLSRAALWRQLNSLEFKPAEFDGFRKQPDAAYLRCATGTQWSFGTSGDQSTTPISVI